MDGTILPINFYCRSARLCLKKAALSKKSQLYGEELQHLKAFETLVISTIPGHPHYSAKKEEKSIVEIRSHLPDAKKRLVELEGCTSKTTTRGPPTACSNPNEAHPGKAADTKFPQRNSSISKRNQKIGGRPSTAGASESSPTRFKPTGNRSRSEPNTPLKSQPSTKTETPRLTPARSPNKIRSLPRKLSEDSTREKLNLEKGSSKMQDSYTFGTKSAPASRKSTPVLERVRSVTECLGSDHPRKPKEKEKLLAKVESLSRETSPLRERTSREMPRLVALGLLSSHASKPTTRPTSRFDSPIKRANLLVSDDDAESLSPGVTHKSKRFVEADSSINREAEKKDSSFQKPRLADYSYRHSPDEIEAEEDPSDRGEQEISSSPPQMQETDQGSDSRRRDEAAWTALKLQEQFGEALKELGGLQDRDTIGCLNVPDSRFLHGNIPNSEEIEHSHQDGCRKSPARYGKTDRLPNGLKSIALQDLAGDGEAHSYKEYMNGVSERSGWKSPDKHASLRESAKPRGLSNGDLADNLSRPHSRTGSEKSDHINNLRGVREDCARFRVQMKVLKEMAEDSRIREFAFLQEKEPVAKRRFDEEHNTNLRVTSKRGLKSRKSASGDGKGGSDCGHERGVNERSNGHHRSSPRANQHHSPQSKGQQSSKNKNKARNLSSHTVSPSLSVTSQASPSSSSSSSSLSSLPLSHYIQKLKHLAPDSRFLSSPPKRSTHINADCITSARASSKFPQPVAVSNYKHHHHHLDFDKSKTVETEYEGRHATSPTAILLPKSPSSSHALSARIQQRIGHLYKTTPDGGSSPSKHPDPDQRLDAVLGGCALVASHLQRQISPQRNSRKERTHRSPRISPPSKETAGGHECVLSFVEQKRLEKQQAEVFDGSMAELQRLVGELKGSVEGVKIRIEVESKGWRSRVEGLEKEIETLKDEKEDELAELKKCIRNEVKARVGELSNEMERMKKDEKDKGENVAQARMDSQSNANNPTIVDLKKQIRCLWAEVETLTKEREGMKQRMDRLAHMGEVAEENTGREIKILRSELRIEEDRGETRKEGEVKAETRKALEKIKEEGLDLKAEVNALKRGEKVMKVELENVKKLVEKVREETEEMERDRGAAQMEGVRERLLIMERVESLSQLYLGGLEEVRTDVYNVKFHCRDRMDELESQWGEYKRQQEMGSVGDHSSGAEKQRLLHEMEHFRLEVAQIMETERGLLRQALEKEHECIRRQMMEIGNGNKNELSCMIKVEMQKRNQAAKDKLTCLPEPMKRDMDRLKLDVEDAHHNAETIAQTFAMVERERDAAAQAAADAGSAAAKAGEVLSELLGQFSSEMAAMRRKNLAIQDNISLEKDAALQAVADAKRKSEEFQQFLLQEKTRLRNAVAMVQHERDAAAAAASEASSSALKAGEVMAEMLGSFNQEMNKARRKSSQLQDGLDRERENLERDREEVMKKSHEAQNRFSEELEKAITTWKRAMDQEVGKAKQITAGLEEERLRISQNSVSGDIEHLRKTDDAISKLRVAVKSLEESAQISLEEKQKERSSKQDTKAKKEQDQKMEYKKLREKIDEALRREQALKELVDESAARVKKLEGLQTDLLQSFQEVRSSTGDLEKTASIWLPKYESAARIVHEINCKVEKLEEKCKTMSADEGLKQTVSHHAEPNFESLKDMVAGGTDLKDLFRKVESGDRAQSQALSMLDARVSRLESVVVNGGDGLSLKLEYVENRADLARSAPNSVAGLTETVESLQRKVEVLSAPKTGENEQTTLLSGSDTAVDVNSKLTSLESRIELVASATFTNLRLLDSKVEECSANAQQALEGAVTAENKCSALGVELVKVFRMLASSRQESPAVAQRTKSPPVCGRDHSPTKPHSARSPEPSPARIRSGSSPTRPSPPRGRSVLHQKEPQMPKPAFRRGATAKPRVSADFTRGTLASEMRKVTTRSEQVEPEEEYIVLGDPARERMASSRDQRFQVRENETISQALCVHEEQPSDKVAQEITSERTTCIQEGEIKGLGRLTISQDRADDKHKEGGNKCQRTNIRLETGRIHVNVSHRSGAHGNRERKSGTDQKSDLVGVQL
ncbi:hypothetical protein R1flu_002795 [Riccia fluitans]|uniref:Uncharacterized protein n=1 Tax=Riccia fluitans TaxID=41844 RepID=A0ABD1Y767_9MARC